MATATINNCGIRSMDIEQGRAYLQWEIKYKDWIFLTACFFFIMGVKQYLKTRGLTLHLCSRLRQSRGPKPSVKIENSKANVTHIQFCCFMSKRINTSLRKWITSGELFLLFINGNKYFLFLLYSDKINM